MGGYLCEESDRCICLGEWGGFGKKGSKDLKWQCELAKYIRKRMMGNNFYWCLNPDSADTGGLLNKNWDLTKPISTKLQLLRFVQPFPSIITLQNEDDLRPEITEPGKDKFCYHFSNPASFVGSQDTGEGKKTKKDMDTEGEKTIDEANYTTMASLPSTDANLCCSIAQLD